MAFWRINVVLIEIHCIWRLAGSTRGRLFLLRNRRCLREPSLSQHLLAGVQACLETILGRRLSVDVEIRVRVRLVVDRFPSSGHTDRNELLKHPCNVVFVSKVTSVDADQPRSLTPVIGCDFCCSAETIVDDSVHHKAPECQPVEAKKSV
jgi:hypothetical protein